MNKTQGLAIRAQRETLVNTAASVYNQMKQVQLQGSCKHSQNFMMYFNKYDSERRLAQQINVSLASHHLSVCDINNNEKSGCYRYC